MRQDEKEYRKEKKKEHAVIFDAVRGIIHEWDPYGLLGLGCPPDEFDTEIQAVVREIEKMHSPQDAVHVLSRVFSYYFETERFRPEDCQAVGEQLYQALRERNILSSPE